MTAVVEWRGYSDGFVLHGIAVVQTNQVAVEIGNFIDVYAGRGAVRCAGLAADAGFFRGRGREMQCISAFKSMLRRIGDVVSASAACTAESEPEKVTVDPTKDPVSPA